jgi:hypothetical protein
MATKTKPKKRKLNLARVKKLSTLLAIGLRDLRKQERAKNSVVDMDEWLLRGDDGCSACLAGSVLRFSLNARVNRLGESHPWMKPQDVCERLLALNEVRCGRVPSASERIGVATKFSNRIVANYHYDRDQWWADMEQLLSDLRKAGE